MNTPWITIVAAILVCLGVLAELNLLRIFVGDWLRGRREHATRAARKESDMLRVEPQNSAAVSSKGGRTLMAASLVFTVPLAAGIARGADLPADASRTRMLSLADAGLSFAVQPAEQPAPEPKPLTISTDRPGFSDSSGIVPAWHLQLETGYTFTFRNRDDIETQAHNAPEVLLRLGILEDRLELRLSTAGYVWSRSNDGFGFESVEGFSDLSVGLKLKIIDQDGAIPRLAFEAATTVGTGSHDVSNRDLEPTIKLIGSWDLGSGFSLTSNAVVTYATASGQRFVQGAGSASVSYSATDQLSVFAEYFVIGPRTKGSDAAHSIDFGGAYLINSRMQIDARVGFGLNQEADNVFAGIGLSVLF